MNEISRNRQFIKDLLELKEQAVLDQVKTRLAAGDSPIAIIEAAQQAMHLVGERYAEGHYFISSMMMAGEIFREVMEMVHPVLVEKTTDDAYGQILLGTVKGDIHDIGKNLFAILLRAHGFTIVDLGVDISPDQFVDEALQRRPDIIAFSGLLTISYDSMRETVSKIRKVDEIAVSSIPFIVGGGMMNAMVCNYVGADYWANDAVVGVNLCKQIMEDRKNRSSE